jgi:hypothetical protein
MRPRYPICTIQTKPWDAISKKGIFGQGEEHFHIPHRSPAVKMPKAQGPEWLRWPQTDDRRAQPRVEYIPKEKEKQEGLTIYGSAPCPWYSGSDHHVLSLEWVVWLLVFKVPATRTSNLCDAISAPHSMFQCQALQVQVSGCCCKSKGLFRRQVTDYG